MTRKRGPYAGTASRKDAILEAANELVIRLGHEAATMAMIAEAVDVSEPTVFYHFPSKELLLVELLRFRDLRAPEAALARVFDRILLGVRNSQKTPNTVILYAAMATKAADPSHPAHNFFIQRNARLSGQLSEAIRQEQSTGNVRGDIDAASLADNILALSDGLQVRWLITRELDMGEHLEAQLRAVGVPFPAKTRSLHSGALPVP